MSKIYKSEKYSCKLFRACVTEASQITVKQRAVLWLGRISKFQVDVSKLWLRLSTRSTYSADAALFGNFASGEIEFLHPSWEGYGA